MTFKISRMGIKLPLLSESRQPLPHGESPSHAFTPGSIFSHWLTRKLILGVRAVEGRRRHLSGEHIIWWSSETGIFPAGAQLWPELLEFSFNLIAAQQGVPSGNQLLDQGFIYQEDCDYTHFPRLWWPFKGGKKRGVWGTN